MSTAPEQKDRHTSTPIVISLGGSLLVPDTIDTSFISSFVDFIKRHTSLGRRFILITGGGKTARKYMDAGRVFNLNDESLDWIGVHATQFNGAFLKTLLDPLAHEHIITAPDTDITWVRPVLIGAGSRPGRSTDCGTVEIAAHFNATSIVNMSNIEYVYDKDPRAYPDAKKIETLSWDEYLSLIPTEWTPGLNSPFDPIASREAQKHSLEVIILSGDITNLENCINNKPFVGTRISP